MKNWKLTLLLVVASASLVASQAFNLIDCNKQENDVLLHTKNMERTFKLLRNQEANVVYSNPNAVITCVEVLDQRTDGSGGNATILEGGLGHHNVTIKLRSQFSRGFSFVINIYGH